MSFLQGEVFWLYILALYPIYHYYAQADTKLLKRKVMLLSFVLFLLLTALAQPVMPKGVEEVELEGTEIIIALDLSASMKATDLEPNRLDAAKAQLKLLISSSQADKFALLGFTSSSIILSPLTDDKSLFLHLFDRIREGSIISKATDYKSLFELTKKLSLLNEKHLIIFSDGGESDFSEEIALANEYRIHVYPVGMATARGISLKNAKGETLLNEEGFIVVSSLNDALKALADKTGGAYFSYDASMSDILDHIHKNAVMQTSHAQARLDRQLFYLPLILALLIFMIASTSMLSRFAVLALLVLPGVPVHAGVFDFIYLYQAKIGFELNEYEQSRVALEALGEKNWQTLYNLGHAYYKLGEFAKARETFGRIQTNDKKRKALLLYNSANCYAKEHLYDKAIEAYRRSLILHQDKQTLENLIAITGLHDKLDFPSGKDTAQEENELDKNAQSKGKKNRTQSNSNSQSGQSKEGAGATKMSSKKRTLKSVSQKSVGLSSQQYMEINKGSYTEKNPW